MQEAWMSAPHWYGIGTPADGSCNLCWHSLATCEKVFVYDENNKLFSSSMGSPDFDRLSGYADSVVLFTSYMVFFLMPKVQLCSNSLST